MIQDDYADIMDRQRPRHEGDAFSRRHPPMPLSDRAKIFMPFRALQGSEEAAHAREVTGTPERDLTAERKEEISAVLSELRDRWEAGRAERKRGEAKGIPVRAVWFEPAPDLPGTDGKMGFYRELKGDLTGFDMDARLLELAGGRISFDRLAELEIPEA